MRLKHDGVESSIEGVYIEEELKEFGIEFQTLFNLMPDSVVIVDGKGKFLAVNDKVEQLTGFKRQELLGKNFLRTKIVTAKSKVILIKNLAKRMMGLHISPYEIEGLTKDGKKIPFEVNATKIEYGGKPADLVIFRDITERKKAEEALRESEEKLRAQYKGIPIPTYTWQRVGEDFVLVDYNNAAVAITHGNVASYMGKRASEMYKDRPEILEELSRCFTEKTSIKREMLYRFMSTRESKYLAVTYGFVPPDLILVHAEDITERKKMEEKLRQYSEHLEELVRKRTEELLESEKRYSVLVEEASDGVVILQDEKIVFTNKRLLEIGGYSRDEVIGFSFEILVRLVDEKYRQLIKERHERRMRGEKVPATSELELIAKTGERVPVEASSTLIQYQGRPATLTIVRDIRERKRVEEERLRLEKLAAIGEVATMVGHDLRNPLQSIENATYYLNNELPRLLPSIPISQRAMEMLQVINDSVNYADKIIRDLHDFSTTKKPILKKININAIVKETLSQVKAPKNVELTTKLGHLPKIKADKDMIKRAFLNLAINGIQAMKEKGGTLEVSTKKTKEFVEVSFKDTGVGMSNENMKKVFTPFFTTKAQGMGMGLPICKKLVEIHGGSIEVENEEGKGSTFTVKLPIQQENGGENH